MSMPDFNLEQADIVRQQIDAFTESAGLVQRSYDHLGRTMLLLDLPEVTPLDTSLAEDYLAQHAEAVRTTGIFNNCGQIAENAVASSRPTGILSGQGTARFVGWGNHFINYEPLDDETTLMTDLTASRNLDYDQGLYHVLGLRAAGDMDAVCSKVTELYGGDWIVRSY